MSSMTTRQRARESSIQLTSVENARRLEDEAMFQRQTYLRKLLHSSGFIAPHGSRIERLLFNIQESAGAELAASELAWFLSNLGKILRRAILRKYAAGERTVKREISDGLWRLVLYPFLQALGCTESQDASALRMNSNTCEVLFMLVGVQLRGLQKEARVIRLAENETIQICRKRLNFVMHFWCEREQYDGTFVLR